MFVDKRMLSFSFVCLARCTVVMFMITASPINLVRAKIQRLFGNNVGFLRARLGLGAHPPTSEHVFGIERNNDISERI